ncbi:hypothetical protein CFBP6626_17815 [Agrobacterium tumefaciens]|nr:hypothetical protein CFBP6626_17815 [Agrobacterium tumefaciens]CUX60309.1 hypothetical protein AGR5A_Lc70300 [Agrobacterium genomosp. 5 str. CFBP 6626]
MKDFAKLFSVDGRHVLAFLTPGETKDYDLHQITYSVKFGATVNVTVGFNVKDGVDPYELVLGRYDDGQAREFIEKTVQPLERGEVA